MPTVPQETSPQVMLSTRAGRRIRDGARLMNVADNVIAGLLKKLGCVEDVDLAVRLGVPLDKVKSLKGRIVLRPLDAFRLFLATRADMQKLLQGKVEFGAHINEALSPTGRRRPSMRKSLATVLSDTFSQLAEETHDSHLAVLFADLMMCMAKFSGNVRARDVANPRDANPTKAWSRRAVDAGEMPGWAKELRAALLKTEFTPNSIGEEVRKELLLGRRRSVVTVAGR